ncbi:MAG: radical SAM protein [Actinomycetota bacterium]|nr:radical SAM protein [Actinomycetota bacterium]
MDNPKQAVKDSPEYVKLSMAAAMTLRLSSGMFYRDAKLYCLNLLLTYAQGCSANCSYCGLARERKGSYEDKSFIRVDWPTHALDTVIERLAKDYAGHVERICISMITHRRVLEDTLTITRRLKGETDIPISVLVNPTIISESDFAALKAAGVQMVGIAVDAATEELFDENRGSRVKGPHNWERYWEALGEAARIFGKNNFGSHLISGLGESEREMAAAIQRVRDLGGRTHLFSFHPEEGSRLAKKEACEAGQYRRIQLARYLIDCDLSRAEKMQFDKEGRLSGFGLAEDELNRVIDSGSPFRTSGCPSKTIKEGACNRPFGDGPPSDIRSFPFKLNKNDVKKVRRQMAAG